MKQMIAILVLMASLMMPSAALGQQDDNSRMNPDDVFTLNEDDIARETRQVNNTIKGTWTYKGPSVDVSGKNFIAGAGKVIAKGKLKGKLKKAFKKIGLNKAAPRFTFNEDGTCAINILGRDLNGRYNYNPDQEKITFKWHGIPLSAHLKRDGKKKAHLTFDVDKLLALFRLASGLSDNSTMKALAFLTDNYEDVMVGFELKK